MRESSSRHADDKYALMATGPRLRVEAAKNCRSSRRDERLRALYRILVLYHPRGRYMRLTSIREYVRTQMF